jgi:DNA-binding XRE family transcriptional regulator
MSNQEKFLALRAQAGITQTEAAKCIADQTMRPCALRTVQAWEAPKGKPSARPCPDWAITALEARLKVLRKIT